MAFICRTRQVLVWGLFRDVTRLIIVVTDVLGVVLEESNNNEQSGDSNN